MHIVVRSMLLFVFLNITGKVSSQVTIQPMLPQVGLVPKSQLWNLGLAYMVTDNKMVFIEIQLKDRISGGMVLSGRSAEFQLTYGPQQVTESTLGPVTYNYLVSTADNSSALLAVGSYEVCYKIYSADQKTELGQNCVFVDVEAMSPPMLSLPEDSAVLETQYPQFSWLPPMPLTIFPNLQYDLVVAEILPGQTPQESLQRNTPVFSSGNLYQNFASYSSALPMLDTGKYYAWQVVARNGDTYGASSEVWVFKLKNPEPVIYKKENAFYSRLTKKIYDAVYQAESPIRFEFVNEENDRAAVIKLYSIDGGVRHLKDSRSIDLRPGSNYITWNAHLPGKTGKEQLLLLSLALPSGQEWGCVLRIPAQ